MEWWWMEAAQRAVGQKQTETAGGESGGRGDKTATEHRGGQRWAGGRGDMQGGG